MIEISTPQELQNINDDLAGDYVITADIDLSSIDNWEPIGGPAGPFTGSLDGGGHKIINLNTYINLEDPWAIYDEGSGDGPPVEKAFIFGVVGGTIKNLILENVTVDGRTEMFSPIPGMAGLACTVVNTTIENVKVKGNIYGSSSTCGLVARVGKTGPGDQTLITNCAFIGEVNGEENNAGIAGELTEASQDATLEPGDLIIEKSYVRGKVKHLDDEFWNTTQIAGIMAKGSNAEINNCYVAAEINNGETSDWNVQTIVGNPFNTEINNCYYDSEVVGFTDLQGTALTTTEMKDSSNYTGWDFTDTWSVDSAENDGYPELLSILNMGGPPPPIEIWTPDDLDAVRNNLEADYKIMADLDFSTWGEWSPIEDGFTGELDGQGHTISNVVMRGLDANHDSGIAIFSYVDGGTLKNINLENIDSQIDTDGYEVAALVGYQGGGTVENCHVKDVYIKCVEYAGALIGYTWGGTITNCTAENLTMDLVGDAEGFFIGGLCGAFAGTPTITNCHAKNITINSTVNHNPNKGYSMGGFSGVANGTVEKCSVENFVINDFDFLENTGGFVGETYGDNFSKCSVRGFDFSNLNTPDQNYAVGGFIGLFRDDLHVDNCYTKGVATAYGDNVGGFAGSIGYLSNPSDITNCYSVVEIGDAPATLSGSSAAFIGHLYENGVGFTIEDSYYDSELVTVDIPGYNLYDNPAAVVTGSPEPKTTSEMKVQETYNTWNFTDLWLIDKYNNDGYPIFEWQFEEDPYYHFTSIEILRQLTAAVEELDSNGTIQDIIDRFEQFNQSQEEGAFKITGIAKGGKLVAEVTPNDSSDLPLGTANGIMFATGTKLNVTLDNMDSPIIFNNLTPGELHNLKIKRIHATDTDCTNIRVIYDIDNWF